MMKNSAPRRAHASLLGSDRTCGARRVWKDLLAEGVACGLPQNAVTPRTSAWRDEDFTQLKYWCLRPAITITTVLQLSRTFYLIAFLNLKVVATDTARRRSLAIGVARQIAPRDLLAATGVAR